MSLPLLYGEDKNGGIKTWEVVVDGAIITTSHGKLGGVITAKVSPAKKGKNIGRTNETSPEQQAEAEALSKWTKQIDKGYATSTDDIQESTLPPLAHKYYDHIKKVDFDDPEGWGASKKLNGVNCTIRLEEDEVTFTSRGGKPYPVIKHIADDLRVLVFDDNPTWVLIGELYCHGMWLEDITAAVKKHNQDTPKLSFNIFEVAMPLSPNLVYRDRVRLLSRELNSAGMVSNVVNIVGFTVVSNEKMFDAFHADAVKHGYEGSVLMYGGALFEYKNRRHTYLKRKDALDQEFEVVGMELDKNGGGVPVCLTWKSRYS